MHNLRIWNTPLDDPVEVVHYLGALQAQEFLYAKWSIAQRTKGAGDAEIQRLLDDGSILRTHLLRPTWHFVLARDIRWLLELTAPRVHALNAYMYRKEDLTPELLAKSNRVLAKSLSGDLHLTRKEIQAVFEGAGIDASGLRLGYLLGYAELEAVICSGARRGKQQTYALLDERAPDAESMDPDDALAELTRRYFTSRGPATVKDFARWSSLKMTDCKHGLEMLAAELDSETVGDRTYWFAPSSSPPKARGVVDLVQVYDECVMSYSESRDALAGSVPTQESPLMHAVLLDGQLLGFWKRIEKGDSIEIETSFPRPLNRAESAALKKAAERFSGFLGKAATLV
ncbi:MAG: hypothetical protein QOG54_52 [Actinomycetota bacterium]|jgi:hypothetical protein|nr:hypothetical protein [Actinomycetota bacterium]